MIRNQGENSSTENGKKWKNCKIEKGENFTKLFPWSCFPPVKNKSPRN